MVLSFDVLWSICRRTWLQTLRRPVALTFSLAQPMIWMLLFGFLFQRFPLELDLPGIPYTDFLVPGICGMTILFGASQAGISLIRDMQTGFLGRLLATPANHRLILGGKVAGDCLRLLAQALAVLLLGLLVGARLRVSLPAFLPALVCLGLFGAAFASLSCLIALRVRAPEGMSVFVHLVNMPIFFTSSALVPGKLMREWLSDASQWNPLTLSVDAFREALLHQQAPSLTGALLPLAALAATLFLLACKTLRSTD